MIETVDAPLNAGSAPLSANDLSERGICTYEDLKCIASTRQPDLVEGLIRERSVNMIVGDSGLGKTPLAVQLGLCVAAGCPFLGHQVRQGSVLYCDAESGVADLVTMLPAVCDLVGVESPPDDFRVWSPNFDLREPDYRALADQLCEQVQVFRPDLIVVDPLRAFWPTAEEGSRDAIEMLKRMREISREIACSWVTNHHRRKRNQFLKKPVSLETDRHIWFEEAAGSLALINGTDTRLGVEESKKANAALLLAGFVRSRGYIEPHYLERVVDDQGDPLGYRVLTESDYLNPNYRQALAALQTRFRFKDAHRQLGGSSSSATTRFLEQCGSLGLVKKVDGEYLKTPHCSRRGLT